MDYLAKISYRQGDLVLRQDYRWHAGGDDPLLAGFAALANKISFLAGLDYAPSAGRIGAYLASAVNRQLPGKVEVPPAPEPGEGIVY